MFKSAATKIAHNSTIPSLGGNKDLKPLQDLITAEKTVLISLQKLSVDFAKASDALRTWGLGEGDDLGDTLSASTAMLTHFSTALSQYATHEHGIRDHLKTVRSREEALDEMKRRRKSLVAKADSAEKKLSKMGPEHKNMASQTDILNKLHEDIRMMDSEIMNEEAALGDFKRTAAQALMSLKFGGLLECSEKGTIAAEYGRLIIAEIPQDTTQPGLSRNLYQGHSKVESLMAEAQRCVSEVTFTAAPPSEPRRANPSLTESFDPNHLGGNLLPPIATGWPQDPTPSGEAPRSDYPPPDPGSYFPGPSDAPPIGSGPYQPPSYPPPQSDQPSRGVDDFGMTIPSGPIDPVPASGGRFATFPVKNRNAGYTGPPSLNTRHEATQSFSSSVAEALGTPNPAPGASFDYPAPAQNQTMYAPPPGPPPGVAGTANPWMEEVHSRDRKMSYSDEDAQLAYMTNPGDQGSSVDHGSKHVRFGEVHEDVQPLPQRAPAYGGPPPPQNWETKPDSGPGPIPAKGNGGGADPQEEERLLNAAAAREVSRELDALTFNPPSPISMNQPPYATQPGRRPSFDNDRPPAAPHPAPFQRSSPHPSIDNSSMPFPGSSQNLPSQVQQAPYPQNPPPYGQPPNRVSPSPERPGPRSISPMINNPPYRGPSEYGIGAAPPALSSNKSSSSVTSSPAPGARTISAAAFKRPPPRLSSDNLTADVNPLSVKKRLPSSPYPQGGPAPSSLSKELPPNRGGDPNTNMDDSFDYISAYVNNSPGGSVSPQDADYGRLGNMKVSNGDGGASAHGYGEGRFATDLDGNLR